MALTKSPGIPTGISADDMRSLIDSLDTIRDEACGIGELTSATVEMNTSDGTVLATYADGEWRIRVK